MLCRVYTVLLASAVGLAVWCGGAYLEWWGWFWGFFLGLVAMFVTFFLVMRRMAGRLRPAMERVKKQAESGMFRQAMDTMRDLVPMSRWVPMLAGQIKAQLGVLALQAGEKSRAIEYLEQSPKRIGEAKMYLAALLYRDKETDRAITVLDTAAPYQRKSALYHNLLAWMLQKQKRTDDAIARLARFAKKDDGQVTKDNLLRLQNGKKMTMKPFGMQWYMLGLERPPPSMMQQMQGGPRG
ncbi:MAG: tetratricopeptide repeat protein, partial [Planctomycetes bacterium]|nr:tetratricopeptide repeat protein [Planctomycetota bacterium]